MLENTREEKKRNIAKMCAQENAQQKRNKKKLTMDIRNQFSIAKRKYTTKRWKKVFFVRIIKTYGSKHQLELKPRFLKSCHTLW